MYQNILVTGQMKLSEVVDADKRTLLLFTRFGIDPGFGDVTVDGICQKRKIDRNFFLLMVNTFLNKSYFPDHQLKNVDVDMLVSYLVASHNYYLEQKIPFLQLLLQSFIESVNHHAINQIELFFNQYIEEVKAHLAYEDETAFPYIATISDYKKRRGVLEQVDYSVDLFEERHDNIQEKLSDLKNLLVKYFPPVGDRYKRIRFINALIDFEDDLINHARIEDKVLIPVVRQIEKQLNAPD